MSAVFDIGITAAVLTGIFFAVSWVAGSIMCKQDQEYEDELEEEFGEGDE